MKKSVDELLKSMTLEEKTSLLSGLDFWQTKPIDRLGIPSWSMTDGPHGLRKQDSGAAINDSLPATCFPSGAGLASTWNPDLIEKVGEAIGREAKSHQVGLVLGPAVNIKRSPLCGRNFEYYSEDPYLAGRLAKSFVLGVQSNGVGTSLKHFAANNQERLRMTIDAIVDERTLREIYLPAFEIAVKEAQPWSVMCSYNRINGVYASENRWLLTKVLKEEWGHRGIVVTDWGAANDRALGVWAGNELEMPGCGGMTDRDVQRAVREGKLSEEDVDRAVRRLLELTKNVVSNRDPKARFDPVAHHELARQVAEESIVLLKNDGDLLPLSPDRKVAVLGAMARVPRYQGGGSSHVNPTKLVSALDALAGVEGLSFVASDGYRVEADVPDRELLDEAANLAASSDVAIVWIGLTDPLESEGFDRDHLQIPQNHVELLEAVLKVQSQVVVVLSNGSAIEMPWINRVPSVVEAYLGGQAGASAVVDAVFGLVNPSGKLAESFPLRLEDTPSFLFFPGDSERVEYRESLYVGYRYYDAARKAVLFPFGHGLSYTRFEYGPLKLERDKVTSDRGVVATIEIANVGRRAGAEVVQLYVHDKECSHSRPIRELKAFEKIRLEAGERRSVTFRLDRRAFAFWSIERHDWVVESGEFVLSAGSSSRDLRSHAVVTVDEKSAFVRTYDQTVRLTDAMAHPVVGPILRPLSAGVSEFLGTYEPGTAEAKMFQSVVEEMPLKTLVRFIGASLPDEILPTIVDVLNARQSPEKLIEIVSKIAGR